MELLSSSEWINDNIISAAQNMLKDQYVIKCGFQLPTLGQVCAYDIQTESFLYMLHNGQCHWVLICTVEAESNKVYVYDSKSPHVTHELKNQIASSLHTH